MNKLITASLILSAWLAWCIVDSCKPIEQLAEKAQTDPRT